MPAAAAALQQLAPPESVCWPDWAAQAQADYLANLRPTAIAALPADTEHGIVNMPQIIATLQQHLPVDAVLIMTPASQTDQIVQDCAEVGITRVWLHKGEGIGAA